MPATAHPMTRRTVIHVMGFGAEEINEGLVVEPAQLMDFPQTWPVTWIRVQGLEEAERLRTLGRILGLHPLIIEDTLGSHIRSKLDDYGEYVFLSVPHTRRELPLEPQQVLIVVSRRFVVTFEEEPIERLDALWEQVRQPQSPARHAGTDYLAYQLTDTLVRSSLPALDAVGDLLDALEDEVFFTSSNSIMADLQALRHDLFLLRRALWPMRDVVNSLLRHELVRQESHFYFLDCSDHVLQAVELIDSYRDQASGVAGVFLSTGSHRLNEVMKILTMISTIFIPLSFIASIYGMNFNPEASPWNQPELNWYWGYPGALGIMATIVVVLLIYFRHKGWIGASPERQRPRVYGVRPHGSDHHLRGLK